MLVGTSDWDVKSLFQYTDDLISSDLTLTFDFLVGIQYSTQKNQVLPILTIPQNHLLELMSKYVLCTTYNE